MARIGREDDVPMNTTEANRRICFVANPSAGAGRLAKQLPSLRLEIEKRFSNYEIRTSKQRGDIPELTAAAASGEFSHVVAVGGDGTINEVAHGFHLAGKTQAAMGVVPLGTGSDFIRSIGVPRDLGGALDLLATTPPSPIDLGVVRFKNHEGQRATRAFINISDFGLGGEVVDRANRSPKWLGSFFTFYVNTVLSLMFYRPKNVRFRFDDKAFDKRITAVLIANGQFFGGGMRGAPKAILDDGKFDVIVLDAMSPLTIVRNLSKLYDATDVLKNSAIHFFRTTRLEAESDERVLIDMDGEQPGTLPAEFEIVPGALRLVRKVRL